MQRLTGRAAVSASLTLGLLLSACGSGTYNAGLDTAHRPVVSRTQHHLELRLAGSDLAYGEEARLAEWLRTVEPGYGDQVAIAGSSPYEAEGARKQITALIARYGLAIGPGERTEIAPDLLRVVIHRTTASVPGCPDWSRPSQPEFGAANMSNFGCAATSNLAAMVANPEDLVEGRSASATDPATAAKAIKSYRERAPTGVGALKAETTKGD